MPEVAYDYVSRVRVEVAANPAATKPQQPAQLSRIKTTQKHNASRTSYFFNNIGQERLICDVRARSASLPIATGSLRSRNRRSSQTYRVVRDILSPSQRA